MKCYAIPTLLPLLPLLLPFPVSVSALSPPLAGGPGYAPVFDWVFGNVISQHWLPSSSDVSTAWSAKTFQTWVKSTDTHMLSQTIFAYSMYAADPLYENANELTVGIDGPFVIMTRATSNADLPGTPNTPQEDYSSANFTEWRHLSLVWSADPSLTTTKSQYELYVDGELWANKTACAHETCDSGKPIHAGGITHIGQEADKPWGDFDWTQSFTGVMDDMRVWDVPLTSEQIKESFLASQAPGGFPAALNHAYDFNDKHALLNDGVVQDLSGKGRDSLFGAMATIENELQYTEDRATQLPVKPRLLASDAPFVSDGLIIATVTDDAVDRVITLKSYDADGDDLITTITSLPSSGTLKNIDGTLLALNDVVADSDNLQSKRVLFTPTSPLLPSSPLTFTFAVSDTVHDAVSATVQIERHTMPAASNLTLAAGEDQLGWLALSLANVASATNRIENLKVRIVSLPARGQLYQACFMENSKRTYGDICRSEALDGSQLEPITSAGTLLTSPRGIVMYQAPKDEFSATASATAALAEFEYELVDSDDESITSAFTGTIGIEIKSVNDAPVAVAASFQVSASLAALTIPLSGLDSDEDPSSPKTYDPSFAPSQFSKVVTAPRGGILYQSAMPEEEVLLGGSPPVVYMWASEVIRFSSQYSYCDSACRAGWSPISTTCNLGDWGASSTCQQGSSCQVEFGDQLYSGDIGDADICNEDRWHGTQILGPPDVPTYADHQSGWDLGYENTGHEWIELRFPHEVFVDSVSLVEVYKPGAVSRISLTEEYVDDNTVPCCGADNGRCQGDPCSMDTEWRTLWTGTPAPILTEEIREFKPPVCPYAIKTNTIRIDLDTELVPGWNCYDAVQLSGTLDSPPGLVAPTVEGSNSVEYLPFEGVHGSDSFEYTTSDCYGWGESAEMIISFSSPSEQEVVGSRSIFAEYQGLEGEAVINKQAQDKTFFSSRGSKLDSTYPPLADLLDSDTVEMRLVGMEGKGISGVGLHMKVGPQIVVEAGAEAVGVSWKEVTAIESVGGAFGTVEVWCSSEGAGGITYRLAFKFVPAFTEEDNEVAMSVVFGIVGGAVALMLVIVAVNSMKERRLRKENFVAVLGMKKEQVKGELMQMENAKLKNDVALMQEYNLEEIEMLEGQIKKFTQYINVSATDGVHKDMEKLLIKADELVGKVVIGAGAYGEVYKSDYRGTAVAVKTMKQVDEESLEGFQGEIMLMSGLRHQNVVTMLGCCWEKDLMALVMEYCEKGTSIQVLKVEGDRFTWDDPLLKWLLDVSRGMNYLHGMTYYDVGKKEQVRGIIHRDLKPDNCLVTETWGVKIADFGEARAALENATMTQVGTPIYIAPEVVKGEYYTEKADVFSFAMTILQFCLKNQPLLEYLRDEYKTHQKKEPTLGRVSHDVVVKGWRPNIEGIEGAPRCVIDLLSLCWEEYPDARPTFGDIVDYAQGEMRNEVMGAEGGGTEGKGSRRTSTSGGLAMRIQMAEAKKRDMQEDAVFKANRKEEASDVDDWKSKCAELERELKELRESDRGAEGETEKKRGKTEVHLEGNLKEVGKDI